MSNLVSVKAAIRDEIEHAKKGVAYYQSLVVTLEQALEKLNSVSGESTSLKGTLKKDGASGMDKPRRGRKPGAIGKGGRSDLPFTGKDFWPSLITTQPQSAPEVLQAAIDRLGITPTSEQRKKLSQRATFALNHLVKTNAIADSGSGRARRFVKR